MTKLSGGSSEEVLNQYATRVPLGRLGKKKDVSNAVLFLTSSAGQWVSGHMLVVDGGEWLYKTPPFPRELISSISRRVEKKSRKVQGQSKL